MGLNAYVRWAPTEKLNMFINGNGSYNDIKSTEDDALKNSGFSFRAFSGVTYTFPYEVRFSVNGGYFGSRIMLQSKMDPFFFMSFGLSKSFLNKKLDVAIRGSNPFQKYMDHKNVTIGANFTQESLFRRPAQSVSLNITYRFGDLKSSIKKVQRGISNEDLKSDGGDMSGQSGGSAEE